MTVEKMAIWKNFKVVESQGHGWVEVEIFDKIDERFMKTTSS